MDVLQDPLAARAEDLRRWRQQFTDTVPIAQAVPRQRATVVGVVHKLCLLPGGAATAASAPRHTLEATIEDGSARLTAEWPGRARLPGVELGAALRLRGTVAVDADGRLRMLNPEYSSVADPHA